MNNVKRELLVVRRLLQLRNRQIHFSASNYIVKIIEPNVVSRNSLHPRSLTTNVLPQTLDGKLNNVSMEQNADIRTINDSDLRIFLNDCVWNKMEDFGFNTLLNQRKQNKVGVISLECCHILMEAYAKKNDFQRISEVYDILREDGVVPQPQTYVYLLECLARLKSSDEVLTLAKKFIKNAEENQISLNDIFDKSIFVRDQRQLVLEIIHRIDKDFQPVYTLPNLNYSNKLVQALNTDPTDSNIQQNPFSQADFTPSELSSFAKEQIEVETRNGVTVDDISVSLTENSAVLEEYYRKKLDGLYATWHTEITKVFISKLNALHNKTKMGDDNIYMCLTLLKPEQYSELVLDALKGFVQKQGGKLIAGFSLYHFLGRRVFLCHEWQLKKADGIIEKTAAIYNKYCNEITSNQSFGNCRQKWQRLEFADRNCGPSFYKRYDGWSNIRCVHVGKFVYDILKEDIKIDENLFADDNSKVPSYKPVLSTCSTKKSLEFFYELHPVLLRLHQAAGVKKVSLTLDQIPMLCPPVPWTSIYSGGHLVINAPFARSTEDTTELLAAFNRTPITELYSVFDNLNNTSNVAWRVNSRILDIVIEIYNKKFDADQFGELFDLQEKLKSLTEQIGHKLSLANHLRHKTFWFAHNRESKGRIFSISTMLNYTHSDLNRSLVMFHQKKPLGKNGLNSLKLFCINLAKIGSHESLEDRIKYADRCMDDILDSADNPLTGRLWWTKSSKPFQTLSCCIEIANAIRSPDPSKFLSGIPVHQDGTCNALQHYAGLSRDRVLAENVNLSVKEKPQDIYTVAIDLVEEKRVEDAKNGIGIAKALKNHVTRSLLKPAIVGSMYGSGMQRNRTAIETQLTEIAGFPEHKIKAGAAYLETKYRYTSSVLFKPAQEILVWLKKCSFHISEECGKSLEWITPLNIPIVITYYGSLTTDKQKKSFTDTRYFSKNVTAFPPNFIMSLEATHMVLTSLNCAKAGLTLVSEHDSFATHAGTVDEMNKICREQFLLLYSQPILENLSALFCEKHLSNSSSAGDSAGIQMNRNKPEAVHIFKQFPKTGDFDLREVLNSIYFFN